MRTVSLWALALLALTALVVIPVNAPCNDGECLNKLPLQALAILLGSSGIILALIAAIVGVVRTVKRRHWGWLVGLVVGVLAPLPAAGLVDGLLAQMNGGSYPMRPLLPLSADLVLTPVVALIYSLRYPRRAAAERSSSPVALPSAEPMGEAAPPPLADP